MANPNAQGLVAITPTPCPAKLIGAWTLDTAALPFRDGANTIEVCVVDSSEFREQQIAAMAAGRQGKMWTFVNLFHREQGREYSRYADEDFSGGSPSRRTWTSDAEGGTAKRKLKD